MKAIKVIVKEPGQPAEIREIEPKLKTYQDLVGGGLIQAIGFLWNNTFMIMNEEGLYKGLQDNIKAPAHLWADTFKGPIFVCGQSRGKYVSMPDKYIQKTIDYLNNNVV